MELRMELQSFKETDFIQTLFISPSDFVYGIYDHQKYIKVHYFTEALKRWWLFLPNTEMQ